MASLTALVARQKSATNQDKAEYDDPNGYKVLSSILDRFRPREGTTLIVFPITTSGLTADKFDSCRMIPSEFSCSVRDFSKKNKQRWRLLKTFTLPFRHEFVDEVQKVSPPQPRPGELELPVRPETVFAISAAELDSSRIPAIAHLAVRTGSAASGGYYLLIRSEYGWNKVEKPPVCEWMSFNSQDDLQGRSL